jgi:hypothetical protein
MEQQPPIAARWIHSFEEDGSDTMVFRAPPQVFKRARGARLGLDLAPDGAATITGTGVADRPSSSTGRWSLESGPGLGILRITSADGKTYEWPIVSLDAERLVLRKP